MPNLSSGAFRSTRLRAPSLVPNSRLAGAVGAAATPVNQQTLVVDAARNNRGGGADGEEGKNIRRRETIFGPDVGEDDEPGWTQPEEGAKIGVDVIKGWVERAKSEEGLHATTTLQALVNLKRPTLQLQQLSDQTPSAVQEESGIEPAASRPASFLPSAPLHVLKFNYDATTPHVHISLSIHPSPQPAVEGKESIQEEEDVKIIYAGTHDGGFNKVFNLPQSAAIDLSSAIAPMPSGDAIGSAADLNDKNALLENRRESGGNATRDAGSEDTNRSSIDAQMGNLHLQSSTQPDLAPVPEMSATQGNETEPNSRVGRFGRMFGRRGRREGDLEAGQIEMTNRDANGAAQEGEGEKAAEEEDKEPERGMRLLIRIEGIGAEGEPLKRRNAQLTHILVSGMWVPDAGSTAGPGQAGKRVWVVKVVRREAIIGAHTFLLKEIYGLSSASNQTSSQTYPPAADDPYASTPNECIVCLTSPRDVVLLPCRHLVVCRDCAVGMVEFGAGGKVARREDGTTDDTGGAGATGANGATSAAAPAAPTPAPQVAGGTTTQGRERRKKKAKGWYCPVCRQPYTSLLRLALPENAKPARGNTPAASRMASRAPSIRSVHTVHTLRRTASRATLPDGAERMLESLRPRHADDSESGSDGEVDEVERQTASPAQQLQAHATQQERPQFVLGPEVDEQSGQAAEAENEKAEVEHREQAQAEAAEQEARKSEEGKKGWKQV